jgi:uncharacterized damage-inducible protein DinB
MTMPGRKLDRMERRRRDLIAQAQALSAEQLTHHPEQGSWSVLEVVEHLVRVEEGIASRTGKPRAPRTWPEAARATGALGLVSVCFVLGRRFKAPVATILPQGGATLTDLGLRWDAARGALRKALEAADPRRPIFRHPVIGLLTPAQTVTFIERHIAHHGRQIGRIRRSPGYPRS